jgi:hypothetical protein
MAEVETEQPGVLKGSRREVDPDTPESGEFRLETGGIDLELVLDGKQSSGCHFISGRESRKV